jgi:isopentenyl diphosphate isomerase/L-lactate dehydrogenase-like FMN-dependent dehydrogenase
MSSYTFPYSTEQSIIKYAIQIALGEKPYINNFENKYVAVERAILPNPGQVISINNIDEAHKIDGVKNIFLNVDAGDIIYPPTSNLDKAGNIIAVGKTLKEAEKIVQKAMDKIHIEIGPPPEITENQIRINAKAKLYPVCKVCKVCDGRLCAGEMPGIGSVGTGKTFLDNYNKLQDIKFEQKIIHSNTEININIKFLEYNLKTPVFIAPVTGMKTNLNNAMSELDYAKTVISGACKSGSIAFVGDGASTDKYKTILQAISQFDGWAIPIFKPRYDDEELFKRIYAAKKTGVRTVGIDIDALRLTTMENKGKKTRARDFKELAYIIKKSKINFILKGIMSEQDAEFAVKSGTSAIIVSNHGGRTIDCLPSTIEALPKIVKVINKKIPVLVDGGFRTGEDVLKGLALGASGVLIGRPFIIYAVGGGQTGITKYYTKLNEGLKKSMLFTGVKQIKDINKDIIYKL